MNNTINLRHLTERIMSRYTNKVDLEVDRVDRSSRSSEREVESVDNIDSKSTFGSDADSTEHGEQWSTDHRSNCRYAVVTNTDPGSSVTK